MEIFFRFDNWASGTFIGHYGLIIAEPEQSVCTVANLNAAGSDWRAVCADISDATTIDFEFNKAYRPTQMRYVAREALAENNTGSFGNPVVGHGHCLRMQ